MALSNSELALVTKGAYNPVERGDKGEFINLQHEHYAIKQYTKRQTLVQTINYLLDLERQAATRVNVSAEYAQNYGNKYSGDMMLELEQDMVTYPRGKLALQPVQFKTAHKLATYGPLHGTNDQGKVIARTWKGVKP
jgi:hypothetical protein